MSSPGLPAPATVKPRQPTSTVTSPVNCYRPRPSSPHIIIAQLDMGAALRAWRPCLRLCIAATVMMNATSGGGIRS